MSKMTEKQLDQLFESTFNSSGEFRAWFLQQTKFAGRAARTILTRSDNPWYQSKKTGTQSETDILLVLEDESDRRRFAIHIENKLAGGRFGSNQPQLYLERAEDWRRLEKYGQYDEYEIVLMAPRSFLDKNQEPARIFHRRVAHEDIAAFIPQFHAEAANGDGSIERQLREERPRRSDRDRP